MRVNYMPSHQSYTRKQFGGKRHKPKKLILTGAPMKQYGGDGVNPYPLNTNLPPIPQSSRLFGGKRIYKKNSKRNLKKSNGKSRKMHGGNLFPLGGNMVLNSLAKV